jgi:hypothetical protein
VVAAAVQPDLDLTALRAGTQIVMPRVEEVGRGRLSRFVGAYVQGVWTQRRRASDHRPFESPVL